MHPREDPEEGDRERVLPTAGGLVRCRVTRERGWMVRAEPVSIPGPSSPLLLHAQRKCPLVATKDMDAVHQATVRLSHEPGTATEPVTSRIKVPSPVHPCAVVRVDGPGAQVTS